MSTTKKIAVTPGDGIGPDVTEQAVQVMQAVASRFDLQLELSEHPVGGTAYDLAGLNKAGGHQDIALLVEGLVDRLDRPQRNRGDRHQHRTDQADAERDAECSPY